MKYNKKKICVHTFLYGIVSLAIGSSICLLSTTNDQAKLISSPSLTKSQTLQRADQSNNTDPTIRINPSNGFNDLITPDGKYSYVLITKNGITKPSEIGGSNSGIACIDNTNGNIISEWYLPNIDAFKLNYTTNIVFGQTTKTIKAQVGDTIESKTINVFDPSTIFVLCGISNLAKAINSVYTSYNTSSHKFTLNVNNGPTVKIFKLGVNPDNPIQFDNVLGENSFYNFAYPSDGMNGYAGFNASGNIYESNLMSATSDDAIYTHKGISFKGFTRTGNSWAGGGSFSGIDSIDIVGFGSYLNYLSYGQNFSYHLGQAYHNNDTYANRDEFMMTTAFINVDRNIGGLYSATVNNEGAVDADIDSGRKIFTISQAVEQADWPVPFAYQWVLADIANFNQDKINYHQNSDIQYSYIDAQGKKQNVTWGDSELALSAPILQFLNDYQVFPGGTNSGATNLFESLRVGARFGSTWALTTGYIIFTPNGKTQSSPKKFEVNNINEYRYYEIGAMAKRYMNEDWSSIPQSGNSSYFFTNAAVTDRVSPDGSLTYLLGVEWVPGDANRGTNWLPDSQFQTLFTLMFNTMFCYDWESISNDDGMNALIVPLDQSKLKLQPSFNNWNLIYLGGASCFDINQMDTSFTFDPTALQDYSFTYSLAYYAPDISPANLGRKLTFLRRKISVSWFVTDGFVGFSAGTSLSWMHGISFWNVKNIGTKSMRHSYDHSNENSSEYAGVIFLPIPRDMASNPAQQYAGAGDPKGLVATEAYTFEYFDEVIYAVKEIDQQFGDGGPTLAFESSHGTYILCGAKTNEYRGSINHVLAYCGTAVPTSWEVSLVAASPSFLFNVTQFTPFHVEIGDGGNIGAIPYFKIFSNNLLRAENKTHDLFSVQNNTDYLIIPGGGVGGVITGWQEIVPLFYGVPVIKPPLKLNGINDQGVVINKPQFENGEFKSISYFDLRYDSIEDLVDTIIGPDEADLFNIVYDYDANYFGTIVEPIVQSNDIVRAANVAIPVKFKASSGDRLLTYFAVIKTDNQYSNDINLTGLKPVNIQIHKQIVIAGISSAVIAVIWGSLGGWAWWWNRKKANLNLNRAKPKIHQKPWIRFINLFKHHSKKPKNKVKQPKGKSANKTTTVKRRSYKVTEPKLTHNANQTKFIKHTATKRVEKVSQTTRQPNPTYPVNQAIRTYQPTRPYNTQQANQMYQTTMMSQNQYQTYQSNPTYNYQQQTSYMRQPVRPTNQGYYPTNQQQTRPYNPTQINRMNQTINTRRNPYGYNQTNATYAYPQNNYMNQQARANTAYNQYNQTYPIQNVGNRQARKNGKK